MTIGELKKGELTKVIELYSENRRYLPKFYTLEDFLECNIRRCECCEELTMICDDELPIGKINGESYKCCEDCYQHCDEENDNMFYDVLYDNPFNDMYEEKLIRSLYS